MATRRGTVENKRLEAKELWLQEKVRAGEVEIEAINTEGNPADFGTKCLAAEHNRYLLEKASRLPSAGVTATALAAYSNLIQGVAGA